MSVTTVTLNPAIDQTITLERLVPGEVHRASALRTDPGGKGINVASCLADWGVTVCATGLLGYDNSGLFEALFAAKGIEDAVVRVPGATRTNIKLVDPRNTTDINLPGTSADESALRAVEQAIAQRSGLVVLAGSLPNGCAPDIYARLTQKLAYAGRRTILDASGDALTAALAADTLPYCLKPNQAELGAAVGRALQTADQIAEEASRLHARGVQLVVVSMGAEGAFFSHGGRTLIARLAAGHVASTVGAGDAMVAGIAAALEEDADLERTARLATAFAVGKLGGVGPHLPDRAAIERLAASTIITSLERTGERV